MCTTVNPFKKILSSGEGGVGGSREGNVVTFGGEDHMLVFEVSVEAEENGLQRLGQTVTPPLSSLLPLPKLQLTGTSWA